MRTLAELHLEEIELKEKIRKYPQKKWGVLKLVFMCLLILFGLPMVSTLRVGGALMQNHNGYSYTQVKTSLLLSIIVIPIAVYKYLQGINNEIESLKNDLEKIISEKNNLNK